LLAHIGRLSEDLRDGPLDEGTQAQFLDRRMEERGVIVDREVMTPPAPTKAEHATLLEIPDDAPDLPF
jgi:hypothetical protein